jgi:hypothetical protein
MAKTVQSNTKLFLNGRFGGESRVVHENQVVLDCFDEVVKGEGRDS